MPTEISGSNPFSGLAQGGGDVHVGGDGYNPPQTNFLGAILEARQTEMMNQQRQAEIDLAKAKLMQAQREQQGKRMAGAFASRNFDPETGKLDENAFLSDLASHPLTQPLFEGAYNDMLNHGLIEANAVKARIDAAHDRASALGRTAYGLLEVAGQEGRDVEPADVTQGLMNQVTLGTLTVAEAQQIITNLPAKGPKLNAAVKQFALEADQEAQSLKRVQGETAWEPSEQGGSDLVQTGPGGQRKIVDHRRDILDAKTLSETVPVETTGADGSPQTLHMTKEQELRLRNQTGNLPEDPNVPFTPSTGIAQPPSARQSAESANTVIQNNEFEKEIKGDVATANVRIDLLRSARKDLERVRTGGGADFKKSFSRFADALGASPDYVAALAGGDLAALERLGGLNTLFSVGNFKNITQQANRDLGQQEFDRMRQAGFDINNQKGTNKFVINYMLGTQELQVKKAEMLENWKNADKPVEKFLGAWTKYERQLIERGILRDPDNLISKEDYAKGKKVEGMP